MNIFLKIKNLITNTFYPKHIKCICCKAEIKHKNVYDMCEDCYNSLPFINNHHCNRCGLQFEKDGSGICLNCKSTNFYFETARSPLTFDKAVVPLIHKFKYSRHKYLAEPLSYLMHDKLLVQDWKIDLICYVPLYLKREQARGYNQSYELANQLSKLTQIPVFNDIVRLRDTPTQTQLSRKERQENVKGCFKVNNRKSINGLNILLIDDVFTSGSTSNEISKELKNCGANKIYILTIAHAGFKQNF